MKKKMICKKNWEMDGITHFLKGEEYEGRYKENYIRNGINTFLVKNKNGGEMSFHSDSEYFDIS